jgi:transposase
MYDISTRAYIVALKATSRLSSREIFSLTGVPTRTIDRIYAKAIERGFEPNASQLTIKDSYFEDAARSGRPPVASPEAAKAILSKVRTDRYGREKSCADIAGELSLEGVDISAVTVWRVLRKSGLRKTKPTRKPGLTKRMRKERLDWCLAHQYWTLEDWKNVIWSDETSVILLHRRGAYRVWRTKEEAFARSVIRERWKGSSEFMF